EEGPPPAVRRQMMWRVLSYFGPYRRAGLVVVGCNAVQAVLGLAPAVVFKALIDTLARPHPSFARVGLLVAAGIGAALAGGLVGVAQSYLSTLISQGIVATLRRELFEALLAQPVGFFTGHKAGDLLSRINTDIDGVEDVVADTVFGLISNVLVTVATLALMFSFSWPLTLAVLVMIPLVGLPARRGGPATSAGPALMILFGGWLVVTGRATVGTVFVFATVLGARLAGAVTALAGMHVNITGSLALFGRLFSYTDRQPEITDAPDAHQLNHVTG